MTKKKCPLDISSALSTDVMVCLSATYHPWRAYTVRCMTCEIRMFSYRYVQGTCSGWNPPLTRQRLGLKPCGLKRSSHSVIRGIRRGPHESTAKKIPLKTKEKERQGIDRLSTDMILKPWYWELESPWIHISKTLILASLTAGLAFTLTSRQLLLQISHGNFILLTICFPPPSPLLPYRFLFPPVGGY